MERNEDSLRRESLGSEVSPVRDGDEVADPTPKERPQVRRSRRRRVAPGAWWAQSSSSQAQANSEPAASTLLTETTEVPRPVTSERKKGNTKLRTVEDALRPQSSPLVTMPNAATSALTAETAEPWNSDSSLATPASPSSAPLHAAETKVAESMPFLLRLGRSSGEPLVPDAPRKTTPTRSRLQGWASGDRAATPGPEAVVQTALCLPPRGRHPGARLARAAELNFKVIPGGQDVFVEIATAVAVDSAVVGELRVPAHSTTGARRAVDGDEVYFVLRGLLECDIDWVQFRLREGDFVSIPHMASFEIRNKYNFAARLVFFTTTRK